MSDIVFAAEAIADFTAGRSRGEFGTSLMLRSAVERQFEILGEALRRLEALDSGFAQRISEHRRIIDFRNVIAHGYDTVDADIVWQIVQDKLPVLLGEARQLLAERTSSP